MYLPLKTLDGGYKVLKMNEEVLLLQTDGHGSLRFQTYDEEYRAVQRVEDWAHYLRHTGFLRVDRGTIVNLHKIELFDPRLKVLVVQTARGPLFIPVAEPMVKILLEELNRLR